MASVKLSHVTKVMAANDARFYAVKDNGKTLDEQDDLAVDTSAAIAALEETFAGLTGSFVTVMISNKNRMDKGNGRSKDLFQREYTVMLGTEKAIAGTNDNGMVKDLVRDNIQLREQILKMEYEAKMDALNKRLEDIESGRNAKGLTGFPLIDGLLENEHVQMALVNKLTGFMAGTEKVTALAGVNQATEDLINQIERVDPDFETITLPLLAQLAINKPEHYKSGINILKSQL
jgi:hypothetical protein